MLGGDICDGRKDYIVLFRVGVEDEVVGFFWGLIEGDGEGFGWCVG